MNNETQRRDPALDALLGEHSTETPPAHVDAAILAAAHRAVGSGPRRAWRWWMPLAAAAVIGVVVIGVLPLAPSIVSESPQPITDVPTVPPGPRADSFKASDQPRAESFKPPDQPRPDAVASRSSSPPPAAAIARPTAKVAAPQPKFDAYRRAPDEAHNDRAKLEAGASRSQAAAAGAIGGAPASEPAPAAGNAAAPLASPPRSATAERAPSANARDEAGARPRTVEEWVARIRTLRGRGDVREATRALADFRAAFSDADARLPADLREWASAPR